ncbi:hypothetical protein DIPPA_29447 [Diplonema papillatum]|nr:hypothetical protein DIPPA_29447 [Diplonema papillatum]
MSTGVDNCEKDALQHQLQAQIRARELGDERYAEATAEIERLTRLLEETRNCAAADAGYVSPHKRLDFSNTSIVASPADTLCVAGRLLVSPPINSLALTSVPDPIQHQRIPVAQPVTQSQAFVLEAVEKYRNEVQKLGSAVKDNRAARESRQSAVHEHGAAILQAQLANAKEEAAAHQKQAHNLAAANDALTGHVAALRAEIDRTNAESAARAGEQNEHIRQLQEEIARLEATRGDASARLAEAEQARRDLERLFADRDAESSTLARKLREVEAEAERADERHTVREREAEHTVSSLRREVTDLRIELDRNASALVHETAASRELSERYASAASRSSSLSVHNEEQARRVGLLEDELAESQDKLQAAAAECAAARAQLHEYQSMLDREQGECAAAVTQRDGLQWHNEALENEVASLKAQLAVAQNESGANAALRASNEDLAMAIDSEKRLLESSQREADSLRTRLAVREAEAAERDARDAQLQAEAARLRDGVAQGDADKRAALDRLTLQQQEAEALRHALREQTALAHHAQIELAAVKARKEAAESELRQVKDEMVRKEVHWKRVVADPSDPAKDRLSASLAADLAQANAEKKELINCVERLQRLVDTMQARAAGGADFSSYPSAPRSGFMSTQSVGAESVAGEQSADRPLYDRRGMHHHDLVRQPAVTASLPGTEGRYREYSSSSLAMRDHSERKIVLDPRAHAAYHQPEEMLKRRCSESLAFEEPSAAAAFPPAPLLANRISAAAASSPWIVKQLHNLQQSLGGASHSQEDLQAKTAYLVDLLTLSVG